MMMMMIMMMMIKSVITLTEAWPLSIKNQTTFDQDV